MSDKKTVVVAGLGEVGKPLFELVSNYHHAMGIDIEPPTSIPSHVDVLHICFPFAIKDFIGESIRYIKLYKPALTVINSTVSVGTTREIAQKSGALVVNSPIRGKHARMLIDLCHYVKFVGALDERAAFEAVAHFASVGLKTKMLSSPEASELSKLTETTYFGVLIAWAQEVERYCDQVGASYDEVVSIYEEIKFFPPVKYFPGVIGGHCVMPNIEILKRLGNSELLNAVQASNEAKKQKDRAKDSASNEVTEKRQAIGL